MSDEASDPNLGQAEYINLRSFKRDGSPADTPVWCAPLDGKLVVFTLRESYKVKRIRREPSVRMARCDMRGRLLGPWHDGRCRVLEQEPEREARAYEALRGKYGWKIRIADVLSRLSGRMRRRVILEIEPAA